MPPGVTLACHDSLYIRYPTNYNPPLSNPCLFRLWFLPLSMSACSVLCTLTRALIHQGYITWEPPALRAISLQLLCSIKGGTAPMQYKQVMLYRLSLPINQKMALLLLHKTILMLWRCIMGKFRVCMGGRMSERKP